MAMFDDMKSARSAIEALGSGGAIDGERISLTGPGADDTAYRPEAREAETKLLSRIVRRAATLSAIGAVAGAALGVVIGIIALDMAEAERSPANLALCAALGALLGSIPGALVGYISSLQPSQPWALTFEEQAEGRVFVGVHSSDEDEILRADAILREHSTNVRRLDRVAS
jgi:hypothetical protein